jgi:hypothetical protein
MDHDNDVEHLFSWLQTPDLRYREFAGAREITDTIVTWQVRANTTGAAVSTHETPARGNAQQQEEYPVDQFPDQSAVRVEVEPHGVPGQPVVPPPVVPQAPIPPGLESSGRLLGGAYREDGNVSAGSRQPGESSLDSVFSRLAGGRGRLPDPRDRLRHTPGTGPSGRPR